MFTSENYLQKFYIFSLPGWPYKSILVNPTESKIKKN